MTIWWRWMRDALSPTQEEVARLIDPGPDGWRESAGQATTPSEREIARVAWPVSQEVFAACRDASSPTDIELNRLLVGLRDVERPRPRRTLAWARPLALAGAALTVAGLTLVPSSPGPVSQLASVDQWVAGSPVVLNAAITVDGTAEVQVTRTASAGTRVDLAEGAAWFEVDPQGQPDLRDLLVVAGSVRVRVKGTRFQVMRSAERVVVEVARGMVEVADGDQVFFLTAGQRWDDTLSGPDGPLAKVRERAQQLLPRLEQTEPRLPEVSPRQPAPASKPEERVVSRLELAQPPARVPEPTSDPAAAPVLQAGDRQLVVDGSSSMAKNEWAVIQKQIRNGEAQVIAALDRFLDQHGDTSFGEIARVERLRLLVERQPALEALAEVDDWLDSYPSSQRTVQVHSLRAGLTFQTLRDCTAAQSSLLIVSTRGVGADAATATAGLGSCALERGDDAEAITYLEQALDMALPASLTPQVREDLREARRRTRR